MISWGLGLIALGTGLEKAVKLHLHIWTPRDGGTSVMWADGRAVEMISMKPGFLFGSCGGGWYPLMKRKNWNRPGKRAGTIVRRTIGSRRDGTKIVPIYEDRVLEQDEPSFLEKWHACATRAEKEIGVPVEIIMKRPRRIR